MYFIEKTYAAYPVPDSIYYTEYNMSAWFSGTLYLNSLYRLNNIWHATYIGTLVGVI